MRKLCIALLLCLPGFTWADVFISTQGNIVAEVCVYGRGESAKTAALAEGTVEILEFIRGSIMFSSTKANEQLPGYQDTVNWLSGLRSMQQQDLLPESLPVTYSRPRLEGSDTCLEITLMRSANIQSPSDDDIDWSEGEQTTTVIVSGEGWADRKNNLTARSAAEQDAFKRAISQVVGVLVNQQRSEFSSTEFSYIDGQDKDNLQEVIAQQLHTRSSGMVKEWTLLSTKNIANNGVEVTIQAVVENKQVIGATKDILAAIGSPQVRVDAPESIKNTLLDWLSSQGIEVSKTANLILYAEAKLLVQGNNSRLALTTIVKDLSGNQYSHWRNDSSIIALPSGPDTERNLVDVHLAIPEQAEALKESLQEGFNRIISQGGLVHKVTISKRYLSAPDKVQALVATIGGASNVITNADKNFIVVSLRYPDSAGSLASAINQSLKPILKSTLPSAQIRNGYEIIFQ